jgi:hypothetical protein
MRRIAFRLAVSGLYFALVGGAFWAGHVRRARSAVRIEGRAGNVNTYLRNASEPSRSPVAYWLPPRSKGAQAQVDTVALRPYDPGQEVTVLLNSIDDEKWDHTASIEGDLPLKAFWCFVGATVLLGAAGLFALYRIVPDVGISRAIARPFDESRSPRLHRRLRTSGLLWAVFSVALFTLLAAVNPLPAIHGSVSYWGEWASLVRHDIAYKPVTI